MSTIHYISTGIGHIEGRTIPRYSSALFFLVSILFHFSFLLFGLRFAHAPLALKDTDGPEKGPISSYVYPETVAQTTSHVPSKALQLEKKALPQRRPISLLAQKKCVNEAKQAKKKLDLPKGKRSRLPSLPSGVKSPEQIDSLGALLHDAIQRHQRYPLNALEMEREGRVTLVFTVYVDGTIGNLRIDRSSGTTSLDEAALLAVREATPFKGVDRYLKRPKEHRIDVVFELT